MNEETMELLHRLVEEKQYALLREQFNEMAYADIAEFIMNVDDEKTTVTVFRILSKDISADVFAYLLNLCSELDLDLAAEFVRKMAKNAQKYPLGRDPETNH